VPLGRHRPPSSPPVAILPSASLNPPDHLPHSSSPPPSILPEVQGRVPRGGTPGLSAELQGPEVHGRAMSGGMPIPTIELEGSEQDPQIHGLAPAGGVPWGSDAGSRAPGLSTAMGMPVSAMAIPSGLDFRSPKKNILLDTDVLTTPGAG
jgi:hypothetical protein